MALVNAVLVARKRWLTGVLYRCGAPGMLMLWMLIKACPTEWLFKLEMVETRDTSSLGPAYL